MGTREINTHRRSTGRKQYDRDDEAVIVPCSCWGRDAGGLKSSSCSWAPAGGVDHHSVRDYYFILRHIPRLLALSREREKIDIRFSLNDKGPDRGSPWIVSHNRATLTCGHVNNVCQDYQRGDQSGLGRLQWVHACKDVKPSS